MAAAAAESLFYPVLKLRGYHAPVLFTYLHVTLLTGVQCTLGYRFGAYSLPLTPGNTPSMLIHRGAAHLATIGAARNWDQAIAHSLPLAKLPAFGHE